MGRRKRKRVTTTLDPELYAIAKSKKLCLSALLDRAVKEESMLATPFIYDTPKDPHALDNITRIADELWEPSDRRRAEQVQAELCVHCDEAAACTGPCQRFRIAYEAR